MNVSGDRGDGSVGKMLAAQASGPVFNPSTHIKAKNENA